MTKNILLLFLSPVRINRDGTISKAKYLNIDGAETENTNESAVRYLLQKDIKLDKIFILASKKIREEQFLAGDMRTHLDFFLERVEKFLPNADCSVFPYDENISGDENLKSVADMAGKIQSYAAQFTDEKIILHVDLTGGMRDTNIMMLDLTRLLEYSGLETGLLLYSNLIDYDKKIGRVDELQNIYDLFQLIAGVEEFVNFGSVKALKNYYADKNLSEPLAKLLAAMENFAEAIKLCHYGQFSDAIINLHDAVRDFAPAPDDVQDILMARLIGRIREDYHRLIVNRRLDDVEVIRWCLNHDYLQQALTLYTERIPEYLGEKNFIAQSEKEEKKLTDIVDKDDWGRNRFYYLFNVCASQDHTYKGYKIYCDGIKSDVLNSIRKKNFDFDTWLKNLNEKLAPLKITIKDEARLRSQLTTLEKISRDVKLVLELASTELEPLREIINKLSAELETKSKGFERVKIIFEFINKLSNKEFVNFFPALDFAKDISDKYPRAFKVYELIFDKVFYPNIPEETFLTIMEKYFQIQNERNHSNHARADEGEFPTAKSLRDFMNKALDEVEDNLPAQQ